MTSLQRHTGRRSGNVDRSRTFAWGLWCLGGSLAALGLGFELVSAARLDRVGALVAVAQGGAVVAIGLVGLLVARREPGNAIGWLYLTFWFLMGAGALAAGYGRWATVVEPGVGGGTFAAWLNNWLWVPGLTIVLSFPVLVFPDGRLVSPRWRIVGWWTGSAVVIWSLAFAFAGHDYHDGAGHPAPNPYTPVSIVRLFDFLRSLGALVFLSALGLCLASLFVRFHRADDRTRAQIKWLFLAGAVTLGFLLVTGVQEWNQRDDVVMGFLLALIPISVGIAITRYHLFDIDRVISRTASYALVTLVLVGVYAAVTAAVSALVGRGSTFTVAAATLTVATLARPVLRRVRGAVDRRFNRSRYDSLHIVDGFGARLRNYVDPVNVSQDLVTTVNSALQPDRLTIWVRQPT